VAKQYVLRLLFLDAPVAESVLADWCLASAQSKHQAALSRLQQLRVLLACQVSSSGCSCKRHVSSSECSWLPGQQLSR